MDLNKLRTFIKVVESGGISRAASVIYRTQQAIFVQIKLLESSLICRCSSVSERSCI